MSVIVGRALPDVRDGLKPVHRRILYGYERNWELRRTSLTENPRVSSVTCWVNITLMVTRSVYDAMVRLAQAWNIRYPLVDGHGNFGSVDGDGAAAMRYTEARMTPFALQMLERSE